MAGGVASRIDAMERQDAAQRVTARADATPTEVTRAKLAQKVRDGDWEVEFEPTRSGPGAVVQVRDHRGKRFMLTLKDSDIDNNSFTPDSASK